VQAEGLLYKVSDLHVGLTIAGSDPGGGAGLQADLKTFHRFGVYGTSAVTLITVQNSRRSGRVQLLDSELVSEQIRAVVEDFAPQAAKTGALGSAAIIEAVASCEFGCPLIVDPVMMSKHGAALLASDAVAAMRALLFPRAALVTPNAPEAALLAGFAVENGNDMRRAAERIAGMGPRAVLIKGGHLREPDLLFSDGEFSELKGAWIETRHTHGTGCTYSAAITALMARGAAVGPAVAEAHAFVAEAIRTAPGLGAGSGPLNHWAGSL
jgi:hydroxymethylpyrimidine/phosphomethylpyrimidine kinase